MRLRSLKAGEDDEYRFNPLFPVLHEHSAQSAAFVLMSKRRPWSRSCLCGGWQARRPSGPHLASGGRARFSRHPLHTECLHVEPAFLPVVTSWLPHTLALPLGLHPQCLQISIFPFNHQVDAADLRQRRVVRLNTEFTQHLGGKIKHEIDYSSCWIPISL